MKAFFPVDQSFFIVNFEGDSGDINISEDVISFTVTEEIQKMILGTLVLHDPYQIYSRQLKNGKIFKLSWGYKKGGIDLSKALIKNPEELTGNSIRTNIRGYIQSPGGNAAANGEVIYNCNFYGVELKSNLKDVVWYREGTKRAVIMNTMKSLGITQYFIDFKQQTDQLTENNAVLQNETYFRFINRLSFEWRCTFKVGYAKNGDLVGLFVDNTNLDGFQAKAFIKATTGGTAGSSKLFEYGIHSFFPNVITYSWKHHIGESGLGDGYRLEIINGQTIINNFVVDEQVVTILKLSETRLRNYIIAHPEQKDLIRDILLSNSLTSKIGDTTVRYFFDAVETVTAPQGLGYSATIQTIGDPLLTCPMRAILGNGFPDMYKNDISGLNKFYIKKVMHNISSKGYKTTVMVADVITAFGGFIT